MEMLKNPTVRHLGGLKVEEQKKKEKKIHCVPCLVCLIPFGLSFCNIKTIDLDLLN